MRIMWHGVRSGMKTGYGNQTALFTPALVDEGHDVSIAGVCDQYQTEIDENGITNYACINYPGNELIHGHFERFRPDIVLGMMDCWAVDKSKFEKINWVPWVMVDSVPALPEIVEALEIAKAVFSPTRDGVRVLEQSGIASTYVPLAIDTETYYMINREKARKRLGTAWDNRDLADTYLAVMVAANFSAPSRKNFGAAFKAWAAHCRNYPDSLLYVHTAVDGRRTLGVDLSKSVEAYGIKDNVIFAPQYEYMTGLLGADYLNTVYNAADVYLCTSRSEGFGLPLIEAQATGCPVIVPNFGAMAELCYSGTLCDGLMWEYHPGAEQMIVDTAGLTSALACHVHRQETRKIVSARVQHYDIEVVMDKHLVPALKTIAENLNIKYKGGIENENETETECVTADAARRNCTGCDCRAGQRAGID